MKLNTLLFFLTTSAQGIEQDHLGTQKQKIERKRNGYTIKTNQKNLDNASNVARQLGASTLSVKAEEQDVNSRDSLVYKEAIDSYGEIDFANSLSFPSASPSGGTPTKSPAPTFSFSFPNEPTGSPTFGDTIKCVDDPNYTYLTAGNTCKKMGSRQWQREYFCKRVAVQNACPRTCGMCCSDNKIYSFKNGNRDRGCKWLSSGPDDRPDKFCNVEDQNQRKIKENCAKTCNYCRDPVDLTPTASPTKSFEACLNKDNYFYLTENRTCKFIRNKKSRREEFCPIAEVRKNCPQACGVCCTNDPAYGFKTYGKNVNCAWVGKRDSRKQLYCDTRQSGKMVRDACPVACDRCIDPIGSNEPTPSISMVPTVSCENDQDYFYVWPERTCKWIRNKEKRRREFCVEPQVLFKCPQSCGTCCIDNPKYKFGDNKSCLWIRKQQSRIDEYCDTFQNMQMVRDACPVTCGTCLDPLNTPTISPAPSREICLNDRTFFYQDPKKTCQWVRFKESRRQEYCKINSVKTNCPQSCGYCCDNDLDYSFKNFEGIGVKCYWVGKKQRRKNAYCDKFKNGRKVSDACPLACDQCKDPIK